MGKIDKAKEYIGALKVYLGFLLASLISAIAGVSKLYLSDEHGVVFWLGIIAIIVLSFGFLFIAKHIHKKIDELEEME